MSNQARLAVEQVLALLEGSDGKDDWSKLKDEDDGEDTYLPDPLEVAQLEVGNGEQSLNDFDMQQTNTLMSVSAIFSRKPVMFFFVFLYSLCITQYTIFSIACNSFCVESMSL